MKDVSLTEAHWLANDSVPFAPSEATITKSVCFRRPLHSFDFRMFLCSNQTGMRFFPLPGRKLLPMNVDVFPTVTGTLFQALALFFSHAHPEIFC